MKGAFRIPVYGGSDPDPATYCPANGYILNPIDPDEWTLLAEFQNNSPYTTTFDPAITASSGDYAWDLGDGTYLVGDKAVSHTYLTTATRTVKLYGKGTCNITGLNFNSDNIIGILDLSHAAFSTIAFIYLFTNLQLTSVVLPSSVTGTILNISIYDTGITGTLDLSMFATFSTNTLISIHTNPSMTGVTFASSVTGTIGQLNIYNNATLTGTLDLSMFATFTATALIIIHTNPSMTGVTFASSVTGTISKLEVYNNATLTGTLDLSMFTAFIASTTINLHTNPLMTGVTFAGTITGTILNLDMYSTGITGTLDLSMFVAFATNSGVRIHTNTSITDVLFVTATTGTIRYLLLYGNTSMGYVDLTGIPTGLASLGWQMQNCGWSVTIVNHVLVDIDGISAGGYSGRIIHIGGTNADPDSSSGGYDGTAARDSLITKGFTVTIT